MITTATCARCFQPVGGRVYVELRTAGVAHWSSRCSRIVGEIAEDVVLAFVNDDRVGANRRKASAA